MKKRVGIIQTEFCYIGTLDEINEVPCADWLKGSLCYVNLADGRFIIAFISELIYL